ncbi:MAG: bacillithiol biosynthesis BshC [Flavobacteriaceae bacterium]
MSDNLRERIVFENGKYRAIESNTLWTKQELHEHLNRYPEMFSPNVIMRHCIRKLYCQILVT